MRWLRRIARAEMLDGAAEAGLICLLVLAPLPFGSVQPAAVLALIACTSVLAVLVLPRARCLPAPLASRRWCLALVCVFGIGLLQIAPLPSAITTLFSPARAHLTGALPGVEPPSSTPLSVHAGSTSEYLARLTAFTAAFYMSAILASRRGARRRLLAGILAAGLFQAVYGSAEYLSGHQHIFTYAKRFYTDSATGTYINRNHYAGALEMAFLVGLGFLLTRLHLPLRRSRSVNWRQRVVRLFDGQGARTAMLGTGVALIALGLVLSYSRSGLAFGTIAAATVVVLDLRARRDLRPVGFVLLLGVTILVLITLAGWDRILFDMTHRMENVSREGGRLRVWRDSLGIIRDYPLFGTGWGTFREIYRLYRHPSVVLFYDHAHNDYLQAFVESGLGGGLALLALLGLYIRAVWRGLARYRGVDFSLMLGAGGGVISLLLHEFTDFNLQIPANALLFSVLAGTLLGSLEPREEKHGDALLMFGARVSRGRAASTSTPSA